MPQFVDLTGKRFGKLVVLQRGNNIGRKIAWMCQCDCGNKKIVSGGNLQSGNVQSCGCLWMEVVPAHNKEANTRHGMSKTKLHKAWLNMRYRCNTPTCKSYNDYGGRGIKICAEWDSFEAFMEWSLQNGFEEGKSIDRIDVDGDYCTENCRWTSEKQQQNNKRNNNILTYNGETHTISEWAGITGIKWSTIKERLKHGWPVERALTEKASSKNKEG